MNKDFDINEVADFINSCSDETQVYIGCDSERRREGSEYFAEFYTVVVIHVDSSKGCKVFGRIDVERDYDKKEGKPKNRMMAEVYRASSLYLELEPLIAHDIHVHLDINPNERYGSSCAVSEATGYIKGVCNVTPEVKPQAWAASTAADRFKEIIN